MYTIDRLFQSYQKKEKEFNNDTLNELFKTYKTLQVDNFDTIKDSQMGFGNSIIGQSININNNFSLYSKKDNLNNNNKNISNLEESFQESKQEREKLKEIQPNLIKKERGQNVYSKWNKILNEQMKITIDDISIGG